MRPRAEAAPIVQGLRTKASIPIAHPINPNTDATRAEYKKATKTVSSLQASKCSLRPT